MARDTLQSLVAAGVIPAGTEVYHAPRQHSERAVTGRITLEGIEIDGRLYASPSGAARAVSGTEAENGWIWWRVKPSGQTLHELRKAGQPTKRG